MPWASRVMGDLSGTRGGEMEGERILIDALNRRFRVMVPARLSEPPANLRIARTSRPWRIYFSMLGTVLPAFFLMYALLFIIIGIVDSEPIMVLSGGMCSLPLVVMIFRLHRPRLVHVRLATANEQGSTVHALPEGGSLRTPVKTNFTRFLVRDDSVLDMPPSKQLWVIFAITVSIGIILTVLLFQNSTELAGNALFVLLAIPLWLAGFSLPVLAWWGTSTPFIGLPTRRREAESWLIAGMASAFPAFVFNSLVAPELIPSSFPLWATELALLALGAPLCEELFKGMAVALFLPSIKGPKHGFQVGFTVGLGFALIENFQYIGSSLLGGPLAATLTILVRGIGSIPGHAVWTAMTGTAIGWMATDKAFKARMTWRAKSLAISAIDIAEGLGLDTDGDGDLSGFDGERPTLEEAVKDAMVEQTGQDGAWLVMDPSQSSLPGLGDPANYSVEMGDYGVSYSKPPDSTDLPISFSPKSLGPALGLAMVGHSLWNGTSYLSGFVPGKMGFGEVGTGLAVLGWTIILIATILMVARRLLRGIRTLDTPF